jgi:hypothetical protein
MVPSACDTRKRFGEDGTHRTAVQGELEIRPCDYASISSIPGQPLADGLTCLFSRPYLSAIGSTVMRRTVTRRFGLHGLTEPYKVASLETDDDV